MKKSTILAMITVAFLTSCSKEDSKELQVNPTNLTMHYDENYQLSVLNATGSFDWSVDNEFNAKVDQTGYVTGNHVGSTTIYAKQGNQQGSCAVKIEPESNLYDTPYLEWGQTIDNVKAELGTPESEDNSTLVYVLSSSKGIIVLYQFTDSKLTSCCVMVAIKNATELAKYLIERYQIVSMEDDNYIFIDAMSWSKCKLAIGMRYVETSSIQAYQVIYMDGTEYNAPQRRQLSIAQLTPNIFIPKSIEYLYK